MIGKLKMYTDKTGFKYFDHYPENPFWAYLQKNIDEGIDIEIEINFEDIGQVEYEEENGWYKFYPFVQDIG